MLPTVIATTPGNVALHLAICALLIALTVVFFIPGETEAVIGVLTLVAAIAFVFITASKIAFYAPEGTIKDFCVQDKIIPGPTYREMGNVRYIEQPGPTRVCIETKRFIAVDQQWKEVVK
jgi:hypothetical protein